MRVLVVAAREPWPLNSGGRLHLYHVLDQLSQRAEVTLVLPRPAEHREHLPGRIHVEALQPSTLSADSECRSQQSRPVVSRLAQRHFGYNAALEAWIRREARPERFDVALLNGAVLGQHVSAFGVPVVWNPQDELVLPTIRDAQFGGWRRWPAALHHAAMYAWFERQTARRAAATIYVSKIDAAYARRWVGAARIEVVQNGVDFGFFRPRAEPPEPGTVVFVGSLEFPPNVDGVTHFARRIWPRIHAGGASRRLLVVGRRPVAEVRALASTPGIELAGDVPDVRPYLRRASAVVVPIRKGGGLKNKVLEGCAMKRPVVASPHALGGLSARVGVDVLSAGSPQQWAERVGRLLDRPEYAGRVARNGYDWVRQTHCWSTTGQRFYEILASAWQSWRPGQSSNAGRSLVDAGRPATGPGARMRAGERTPELSESEGVPPAGFQDGRVIVGEPVIT
jgi:glycosyltransferase involved in cell wall biosynthesis